MTDDSPNFERSPTDYRAYIIGTDGHFCSVVRLECAGDAVAMTEAKQLVDGRDVELWHGALKVAAFCGQAGLTFVVSALFTLLRNCERAVTFSAKGRSAMDNLHNKGQPDRSKINMHEDYEVKYWTRELGVSKETLQKAVDKVGNAAASVRKELDTRGSPT
jgi:hypothetical protein